MATNSNRSQVEWSWSNYFKNNTPDTLQRIAKTLKLVLGLFTSGGVYATSIGEMNAWFPMISSVAIVVIDQVIEFAGHVQGTIGRREITGPEDMLDRLDQLKIEEPKEDADK